MKNAVDSLLPRETHSASETRQVGESLSGLLGPGAVLALSGDLGAGKTHFVKGLVDGLGGDGDEVSSPTFTIAQEYATNAGPVLHVDAYRVRDIREFLEMGIEDAMDTASLVAIEWPDRMGALLPEQTAHIEITHLGGDRRLIRVPS